MNERRQHPRYPTSGSVTGILIDSTGQRRGLTATTLNVSRSGLAMAIHGTTETIQQVPCILSEDQSVTVEVELVPGTPKIRATGSVRWHTIRSLGHDRSYYVAGMSLDVRAEDKENWDRFIDDMSQKT